MSRVELRRLLRSRRAWFRGSMITPRAICWVPGGPDYLVGGHVVLLLDLPVRRDLRWPLVARKGSRGQWRGFLQEPNLLLLALRGSPTPRPLRNRGLRRPQRLRLRLVRPRHVLDIPMKNLQLVLQPLA